MEKNFFWGDVCEKRRTVVLPTVLRLWNTCPESNLVPLTEHAGAASSDLFAVDLFDAYT